MSRPLSERRQALLAQSAQQRAAIIAAAEPLVQKATSADRLLSHVRRYPIPLAALGVAIVLFGSRKLFDVASRALTVYALFRR
jgi:hypothetical protein